MKTNSLAVLVISLSVLMVGCGGGTRSDNMGSRLVDKTGKKVESRVERKIDNKVDILLGHVFDRL